MRTKSTWNTLWRHIKKCSLLFQSYVSETFLTFNFLIPIAGIQRHTHSYDFIKSSYMYSYFISRNHWISIWQWLSVPWDDVRYRVSRRSSIVAVDPMRAQIERKIASSSLSYPYYPLGNCCSYWWVFGRRDFPFPFSRFPVHFFVSVPVREYFHFPHGNGKWKLM